MMLRTTILAALIVATPAIAKNSELTPRKPLTKLPAVVLPANNDAAPRLRVKFMDHIKARAMMGDVLSLSDRDLSPLQAVVNRYGLSFRPLIDQPEFKLASLESRAAAYSGKVQPDLGGMMWVDGPQETIVAAANALNRLAEVEFAAFELDWMPGGPPPDPECGTVAQSCYEPGMGPFCSDMNCCELVGQFDPFCVNEDMGSWDILCANLANLLCNDGDRCEAPLVNGSCFIPHLTGGCNDSACCNLVCAEEPFCCQVTWDSLCVGFATDLCTTPSPGATPDYTETAADPTNFLQKYRTPEGNADFLAATGFTGHGLDLQGMWNLGEYLLKLGAGEFNGTRGRSIRVGVIEYSAYINHEDLIDNLVSEPGQTVIEMEIFPISSSHGTASLSMIGAGNNGFGMTGIADQCKLYFFPIVSLEQGGRMANAIISASLVFEPGDVLNYSMSLGGNATLVADPFIWTLVRMCTDLGITSCMSAGNSCANIDGTGQFGDEDSGAIIVGACWPGGTNPALGACEDDEFVTLGPFCRMGFSNFCNDCSDNDIVHISAWGTAVAAAGYGDVQRPGNNMNRSYTRSYGGTSAASPMIAGLVANLQGLAKQIFGIPLHPLAIKTLLENPNNKFPQCGIFPVDRLPGSTVPCGADADCDADPNLIGGFPRAIDTAIGVLTGTWYSGSPNVNGCRIVRGDPVFGNCLALQNIDGVYYSIRSKWTTPGSVPGEEFGTSTPGVSAPVYLGYGQITDLEVSGTANIPVVNTMTFTEATRITAALPGLLFCEAYNWTLNRWVYQGFRPVDAQPINPAEGINFFGYNVMAPQQYIRASDKKILVRFWTIVLGSQSLGTGRGGGGTHSAQHDFVGINLSSEFGEVLPPPPPPPIN